MAEFAFCQTNVVAEKDILAADVNMVNNITLIFLLCYYNDRQNFIFTSVLRLYQSHPSVFYLNWQFLLIWLQATSVKHTHTYREAAVIY